MPTATVRSPIGSDAQFSRSPLRGQRVEFRGSDEHRVSPRRRKPGRPAPRGTTARRKVERARRKRSRRTALFATAEISYNKSSCESPSRMADFRRRLRARTGSPSAFSSAFSRVVEDFLRAVEHGVGQAREPRDLDAVALVRAPGQDLAQEDHLVVPFAHGDIEIHHAVARALEVGEFVVVRREERAAARPGRAGTRPRSTRSKGRRRSRCRARSHRESRGLALVALFKIFAVSFISTMNVDCPLERSSLAPTRVKMRSVSPTCALRAGT